MREASITERLRLAPVNGAPLGDGFVGGDRPRKSGVYARRWCILEAAEPSSLYELVLLVHPFDPTCSNIPATFASATLRTDAHGNGMAVVEIRREDVPESTRRARHGVRWLVTRDGEPVYRTECASVVLDDAGLVETTVPEGERDG